MKNFMQKKKLYKKNLRTSTFTTNYLSILSSLNLYKHRCSTFCLLMQASHYITLRGNLCKMEYSVIVYFSLPCDSVLHVSLARYESVLLIIINYHLRNPVINIIDILNS